MCDAFCDINRNVVLEIAGGKLIRLGIKSKNGRVLSHFEAPDRLIRRG
jgi:hypothetical protein